jgi:hypothetical protein
MSSCLSGIFDYLDALQEKYAFKSYTSRNKVTRNNVKGRDSIIDSFYATTTKTFADLILIQYKLSELNYEIMDQDEFDIHIRYEKKLYTVSNLIDTETCSCVEYKNTNLPCRHIFFVRKHLNKPLFVASMVPDRLKLDYTNKNLYENPCHVSSSNYISISSLNTFDQRNKKRLTSKEKYNLVWRSSQELCNSFTSLNDSEFEDKFNIFLLIKSYFEKKVIYKLLLY